MYQTILVVSADQYRAKVLHDCLEGAGYEVRISGHGKSALKSIWQARPILVVLDWKLPDLSGLAVMRMIRADDRTTKLPVVLTGVEMSEEDRLLGFEAGADICLTEEFNPKVFVARVRALLRRADNRDLPVPCS